MKAGYSYEKDNTTRSVGDRLNKRLLTSELMLFLSRLNTDVFLNTLPAENTNNAFLPSFALRREKHKNILGTSRFSGIYYTNHNAFAMYCLSDKNDGLYPDTEKHTFNMSLLTAGKPASAVFTGMETTDRLIEYAARKTTCSHSMSFIDAAKRMYCPTSFIPMSDQGIRMLRVLSVNNYREKILNVILKSDYKYPRFQFFDGESRKSGKCFTVALDFDIARILFAAEYGVDIIIADYAMDTAKELFSGHNVILHPMSIQNAEQILGIPSQLPVRPIQPYITGNGEFINAPVKNA